MVVLGEKHIFTDMEMKKLSKKFRHINKIVYKDKIPDDVIIQLDELIRNNKTRIIVLNTKATIPDELIKYLTNIQFEYPINIISIEHFLEKYLHKCYIPEDHKDISFLDNIKTYTPFQYFQKRVVDYIGCFFLFIILFLLSFIVKAKINKQSPGSLYFHQNRVGKNKKIFLCNKFRTMHENSYHDPYTKEGDSRIYPFGNFMRKTRIDEIPQIKNIIAGQMHLVGPRAEWDILVEKYEKEIPYYHERHLVMPGITGWAQVKYPYGANAEDARQKLMYDMYYIKYWNILLELKVIWKTVSVIINRKGI